MKYVITGGAGNISRPLAEKLLAEGHEVVAVGRHAEHLQPLVEKGAQPAVGAIEDGSFLKKTFAGADAVYIMIPPQYAAGSLDAYGEAGENYAEAIRESRIKHVVNLSSIGAHLPEGCGPVSGLYLSEHALNKLDGVNVLHLRPGYFYLNLFGNIGMIKGMNILGGNFGDGSASMILSHPLDIAQAAADELLQLSFRGHTVRYLYSDERTTGDIARVLGAAVGKPDLPWVEFTDEQNLAGMVQAGLPEGMAAKYVEMGRAMRTGIMTEDFFRNRPQQAGRIKLEDFAKDFAAAYQAG